MRVTGRSEHDAEALEGVDQLAERIFLSVAVHRQPARFARTYGRLSGPSHG
jgi:hypothetical protein